MLVFTICMFVQKLKINFKNIKVGPCVIVTIKNDLAEASPVRKFPCAPLEQVALSVRKVYIECENDLTETQKDKILELKFDDLNVFCVATTQEYKKGTVSTANFKCICKFYKFTTSP